jgi:dolichyl-phosphate-mannose--protein O-mannosyl transferase
MTESTKTGEPGGGTVLGFPLAGFGLFTSLLLAFAAAFFTFFATTCIAIFSLLAWNLAGHHAVSYAASYRWVGFPAGLIVLIVALPLFGTLWVRAKLRKS